MKKSLPIIAFLLLAAQLYAQKIVILGSSTAAGTGASKYANSWVGRLQSFYRQNLNDGLDTTVINLAVGGFTSYNAMPTNYVQPTNRPAPDTNYNITKALSFKPDVVILSFVSNDAVKSYSVAETFNNLSLMANMAIAAGAVCYISTPQPRNNITSTAIRSQLQLRDTILKSFNAYALNFWDSIVTKDGNNNILPAVSYGDGIHLNDSGHAILFRQVPTKPLFKQILQPLIVSITASPVVCYRGSTRVTVNASGGTLPYTGTGSFIVSAGSYSYTVTDANGNTALAGVNITQTDSLYLNVTTQKNISVFGDSSGSINVAAKGGIAPYLYKLNENTYSPDTIFNNLIAGNYVLNVKDSLGCISQSQTTISQPNPPCALCVTTTPVLCYGGYSNVTVNANFGRAPYKYSINGTTYQTTNILKLKAGNYTLYTKDYYNIQQTINVTITQPASFTFTATLKPVSCFGYNDGSVAIKYKGGTAPYMFKTDNNNFISDTAVFNLLPTSYKLTAQDSNGCIALKTVQITEPLKLNATSSATSIACYNNYASLTTNSTGGTGGKLYSFDNTNFHTSYKVLVKAGTYAVIVKDTKGCTAVSNTVIITQPISLVGQAVNKINVSCKNGSDGSVTLAATGGTTPYQYSIDDIHYQSTGYFTNLKAATYTFRIIDSNKCKAYYNVTITQPATACNNTKTAKIQNRKIDNDNAFAVNIFPNPTPGNFIISIKTNSEKPIQMRVTNIYGKTVYNKIITNNRVLYFGDEFAEGIYIAEITEGTKRKTFKLIKSK